jgi:hypothetical protein
VFVSPIFSQMYDEDFEEEFEEDFEKDSDKAAEDEFEEDFEQETEHEETSSAMPTRAHEPQLLALVQIEEDATPILGAAIPTPKGATAGLDVAPDRPQTQKLDSPSNAVDEPSASVPQEPQPKQPKPPDVVVDSGQAQQSVAQGRISDTTSVEEGPAIETVSPAPQGHTTADPRSVASKPSTAWAAPADEPHKSTRRQEALAAGKQQSKRAAEDPTVTAKPVDHRKEKQVGVKMDKAPPEEVRVAEKPVPRAEPARTVEGRKREKTPKKVRRTGPKDKPVEKGGEGEQEGGVKEQQPPQREEEARRQSMGGDPMILRIEGDRLRFDVGEALRRIRIAWDKHKEVRTGTAPYFAVGGMAYIL